MIAPRNTDRGKRGTEPEVCILLVLRGPRSTVAAALREACRPGVDAKLANGAPWVSLIPQEMAAPRKS